MYRKKQTARGVLPGRNGKSSVSFTYSAASSFTPQSISIKSTCSYCDPFPCVTCPRISGGRSSRVHAFPVVGRHVPRARNSRLLLSYKVPLRVEILEFICV